jgi:hypothetical protein
MDLYKQRPRIEWVRRWPICAHPCCERARGTLKGCLGLLAIVDERGSFSFPTPRIRLSLSRPTKPESGRLLWSMWSSRLKSLYWLVMRETYPQSQRTSHAKVLPGNHDRLVVQPKKNDLHAKKPTVTQKAQPLFSLATHQSSKSTAAELVLASSVSKKKPARSTALIKWVW